MEQMMEDLGMEVVIDRRRDDMRELPPNLRIVTLDEIFPEGRWEDQIRVKRQDIGFGENRVGQRRHAH